MSDAPTPQFQSIAWRPRAWRGCFNPPMPESTFYLELSRGLIDIVKAGTASWVTTQPAEYLRRRQAFNEANKSAG